MGLPVSPSRAPTWQAFRYVSQINPPARNQAPVRLNGTQYQIDLSHRPPGLSLWEKFVAEPGGRTWMIPSGLQTPIAFRAFASMAHVPRD
jgi:hypothetical protein